MNDKLCNSCQAPIRFVVTSQGRPMPLDRQPVEGGNVVVRKAIAYVGRIAQPGEPTYISHFATCPNGPAHRTKKATR